jgi:hypothetical protein
MGCGGRGSVGRAMGSQGGLLSVSEHLARKDDGAVAFSAFAEASTRHAALELGLRPRACRVEAFGEDGGSPRTVKSCGPDAWKLASSLAEAKFGSTGSDKTLIRRRRWQQSLAHRGERVYAVKPLRAGMPGDFRCHRCEYSCAFCYHFAREAAGASGTRHSPRPLLSGRTFLAKARAHRAAGRERAFAWLFEK